MFIDKNQFSLHIEEIKVQKGFATYIEALTHFYENETDQEFPEIVKLLNKKILDSIEFEATDQKLLKHNEEIVRLM